MTPEDIKRLIAMLKPQCDKHTIDFVVKEITMNVNQPPRNRSDQQRVDVYDSGLANDPLKW